MVLDVNKDGRIDEKDGIIIARCLLSLRGDARLERVGANEMEVQKKMRALRSGGSFAAEVGEYGAAAVYNQKSHASRSMPSRRCPPLR